MKINKVVFLIVVFGLITFFSCNNSIPMDETEIENMTLITGKGVFAGIDIGDKWSDLKSNTKLWELDEEYHIIRKDWLQGFDYMLITIDLDSEDRVKRIDFEINGINENTIVVKTFFIKVKSFFNNKFKSVSDNSWEFQLFTGEKYSVIVDKFSNESPNIEENIHLIVEPLGYGY